MISVSKRHGEILRILGNEGTVSVSALADRLRVSSETVRRDLRPLTADGTVVRMHGAVGLAGQSGEAPFQKRMRENAEAKQAVARHLASTIRNGDSLMVDTGTTTSFLARALVRHDRLTVITNSTDIARTLSPRGANRVILVGGRVNGDSGAALGGEAVAFARQFTVQHAVITAGAIDADGIMDFDPDEADFARAVLSCGRRRVAISDHTKFGRDALVRVLGFDGIDELYTDRAPPMDVRRALDAAGAGLRLAPGV